MERAFRCRWAAPKMSMRRGRMRRRRFALRDAMLAPTSPEPAMHRMAGDCALRNAPRVDIRASRPAALRLMSPPMSGVHLHRGRRAAVIENSDLRVTVLQEGGHIAEVM